jgi:hypothetical protein
VTGGATPATRGETIAGWILSGLVILFLLMDAGMKLVPIQPVFDTMKPLGWPADPALMRMLGVLTLVPALLYIWRPTALIGAILLTAYLGGAVATHVRVGSPLFSHVLFGVYLGLLLWVAFTCAIRACARCCAENKREERL